MRLPDPLVVTPDKQLEQVSPWGVQRNFEAIAMLLEQYAFSLPGSGEIRMYGGATAPTGWLLCDGTAYSRTTYAALYAVVSTTYGVGDGSTTFNVPDLRGRVPVGPDGSAGRIAANDALGNSGGAATHTLTAAESGLRDHTHDLDYNTRFVPGNAGLGTMNTYETPMVGLADSSTNGVEGGAVSGSAHNNLQPYQVVNFIIKA